MQKNHLLFRAVVISLSLHGLLIFLLGRASELRLARKASVSRIFLSQGSKSLMTSKLPSVKKQKIPHGPPFLKGQRKTSTLGRTSVQAPSPESASEEPAEGTPGESHSFSPAPTDQLLHPAMPKKARKVKPEYPPLAVEMGVEGNVTISVALTYEGKIQEAKIKKALGFGCDESALAAIKKFEFEPAVDLKGQPVDSIFDTEVQFRLD